MTCFQIEGDRFRYDIFPQMLDKDYLRDYFIGEIYRNDSLAQYQSKISKGKYMKHDFNNRRKRVQDQFNSLEPSINVYLCWLLVWAATLEYQE